MNSQFTDNTRNAFFVLLGLILFVIGWVIGAQTVSFTNAGPEHLAGWQLDNYVQGLSAIHNQTQNDGFVLRAMCNGVTDSPDADLVAIRTRRDSGEIGDVAVESSYDVILGIVNAQSCADYRASIQSDAATQSSMIGTLGSILGALLVLGILGLLAYLYVNRTPADIEAEPQDDYTEFNDGPPVSRPMQTAHTAMPEAARKEPAVTPPPPPAPVSSVDDPTPLGGFQTTYIRGDDAFDKSFIIENGNGDFLGECGVSISESVGTEDGSRNVTAFEIWLFDKNDTHTVTKVVMSDHAFNDEAVRAKLAPRGEPILASYDNTVALETNSLIINADVSEIDYSSMPPSGGVFERFTVDLSAWVKSESEIRAATAGDALDF